MVPVSVCILVSVTVWWGTNTYSQSHFETSVKVVEQRSISTWIETRNERSQNSAQMEALQRSYHQEAFTKYGSRIGGWTSLPFSIDTYLPVRWEILRSVGYDLLWPELEAKPRRTIPYVALFNLFNIDVQVPRRSFVGSDFTMLHLEVFNDDESAVTQIYTPLHKYEGNRYRLLEATEFISILTSEIDR